MITYHIEPLARNLPEIKTLIEGHWLEIANNRDKIKLDPDWDQYQKLCDLDMVTLFTVRDSGRMVGYSVFMVHPLLHYKADRVASNDIVYLLPKYRQGFCGVRLLKMCHEHFKALGIEKIHWHLKPGHDWSKILERWGYKFEEKIMGYYAGK